MLRRRDFLRVAGWGLFTLKPAPGLAASLASPLQSARTSAQTHSTQITLEAFLDTLIPADELTPSASQTGMATRMLQDAKTDRLYGKLLTLGCIWLDLQTTIPFHQLPEDIREKVVAWMSQAETNSLPRKFFELHRSRAMQDYYSDMRSWSGLAITRPPQPYGYPDFEG